MRFTSTVLAEPLVFDLEQMKDQVRSRGPASPAAHPVCLS